MVGNTFYIPLHSPTGVWECKEMTVPQWVLQFHIPA